MQSDQQPFETVRRLEWKRLYENLGQTLSTHGRNDPFGDGDYFLIDDDYGTYQHKIECCKESFFRSGALRDTQELLCQYESPWQVIFVLARSAGGPAACTVTRADITPQVTGDDE
jgi:hypothetical protein